MEYKITKEDLENNCLYETLKAVRKVMEEHGLQLYVVGARARDIAMKIMKQNKPARQTTDLDVGVMLEDWNKFDEVCKSLINNNFKRIGRSQKFYYKGVNNDIDFEIDLVPFGDIAEGEKIKWPPEGNPEMSVRCFEDVMGRAEIVEIDSEISFKMAPICGQFLIKLDTWNDRHARTNKDAEDMILFIKSYLGIWQDHFGYEFPEEAGIEETDEVDVMGSKLLAYESANLLSNEHLEFYVNLLNEEIQKEESSKLVLHLMDYWGSRYDEDNLKYEKCRGIIKAIHKVYEQEIQKRQK